MTFMSVLMEMNMNALVLLIVVVGTASPAMILLWRLLSCRWSRIVRRSDADVDAAVQGWIAGKRFCEDVGSLADMAEAIGISDKVLGIYFKERLGMSFRSWRNMLRIEEAKCLLIEAPDMSAQMIGEIVGFSDRSNFHNAFVREVGCSPKEWRDSGSSPS